MSSSSVSYWLPTPLLLDPATLTKTTFTASCNHDEGLGEGGGGDDDDDNHDDAVVSERPQQPPQPPPALSPSTELLSCLSQIDCLCLGTGRFLRSVLVPALVAAGFHPALVQTRGRSFLEFMIKQQKEKQPQQQQQQQEEGSSGQQQESNVFLEGVARSSSSGCHYHYPVETVLPTGEIRTDYIPCYGAFSIGTAPDKAAFYRCLPYMMQQRPQSMPRRQQPGGGGAGCILPTILGIGVTEGGLAGPDTQAMRDLFELFQQIRSLVQPGGGAWDKDEHPPAPPSPPPASDGVTSSSLSSTPLHGKICVINTDNMPNNGTVIQQHMMTLTQQQISDPQERDTMLNFFHKHVSFHDSMVDRITSQRPGSDGLVPRAEPTPTKALVLLDQAAELPVSLRELPQQYGVLIRSVPMELQADLALKLRVANGTHTALAHLMALCHQPMTDALANHRDQDRAALLLLEYVDTLAQHDIFSAGVSGLVPAYSPLVHNVYLDWRQRLTHPYFGLSTFFITQNGAAKGGIRLGPTIQDLARQGQNASVSMALAFAALLRWLTPSSGTTSTSNSAIPNEHNGIYRGWLAPEYSLDHDHPGMNQSDAQINSGTVEYADGLQYNLCEGWYEFRCACKVALPGQANGREKRPLSQCLAELLPVQQPVAYVPVVRAYLLASDGGDLAGIAQDQPKILDDFVRSVATLYARMVANDNLLDLLQEMHDCQGVFQDGMKTSSRCLDDSHSWIDGRPLYYRPNPIPDHSRLLQVTLNEASIRSVVTSEVASAYVIDLHTHLLPPSHGSLCLWGIDELLTYHYLVAEYFMSAPASMTPEDFYSRTKQEQADIVWKALFLDRTPISEACRGVITTLVGLGLEDHVQSRNLGKVREFYSSYRDRGVEGAEAFSDLVHRKAGVRYNIMTNIPFNAHEAQYWRPKRKDYPEQYRPALRVDPLVSGDIETLHRVLKSSGYELTLNGARQYLREWCDTMQPEYMMASTPHDWALPDGQLGAVAVRKGGYNNETMKTPGAFAELASATTGPGHSTTCVDEDDVPSYINESSDLVREVLMPVCEERDLPVALKIGAHRGVNPTLKDAGDGVQVADVGQLRRLCVQFPRVRFLATFLSRNNQHEACVLASKFRNLHLYGCWWYCNNPSIIADITRMRLEMLGTAYTAQHSDARVLDQLIYKWAHSRAVIAAVLQEKVAQLCASGWTVSRSEVRRDVHRLLGGSYEEFMAKSLR